MPTLADVRVPPPKGWQEFEKITLSAMRIRWDNPNLQGNGRQGQEQNGVDIFGEDNLGRFCGIQCKNFDSDTIELKVIKHEIDNAANFKPVFAAFYVATTTKQDAPLQRELRLLSADRVKNGLFPVGLIFWEEIVTELARNVSAFKSHFPGFAIDDAVVSRRPATFPPVSVADFVFQVASLDHDMELLFDNWPLHEDPHQLRLVMSKIEGAATEILTPDELVELTCFSRPLTSESIERATGNRADDWTAATAQVRGIEAFLARIEYRLDTLASAVFLASRIFATWRMQAQTDSSPLRSDAIESIRTCMGKIDGTGKLEAEISAKLESYNANPAGLSAHLIPGSCFQHMRQKLLLDRIRG